MLLDLDNIKTYYGNIRALKGISIEVDENEVVCLIGGNGAGKSTTLMTISGVLTPVEGDVLFQGQSIVGLRADSIVQMGICHLRNDKEGIKEALDRVFELFPAMSERRKQYGGTLSGGEQQMLAIARALMGRPKLLLLDEPSLGLAPIFVDSIFETIQQINEQGTTILLVEQNAQLALQCSNRGYVLETGKIALAGTSEDLLTNEQVRKAYLGE